MGGHQNQNLPNCREMTNLGRVLKELREDLGWSLRKTAQAADISPAHLCKIEKGATFQSLGIHVLLKLAQTYQIPLSSILKMAKLIEESEDYLPPLDQYLRMKFHLSPPAIRDVELAKTIVETKYNHLVLQEHSADGLKKPPRQGRLI